MPSRLLRQFFPIPPDILLIPLCLGAIRKPFLPQFAQLLRYSEDSRDMQLGILHGMVYRITFISMFLDSQRKNLQNYEWYAEWGWHWSFGWIFPDSLQNFHHCKRSARYGNSAFHLGICCQSIRRFFLVALLIAKFGEPMKEQIDKHFNKLALVFGLLLIGGFVVLKVLIKH